MPTSLIAIAVLFSLAGPMATAEEVPFKRTFFVAAGVTTGSFEGTVRAS
jgi:hypothetical protein